MVKVTITAEEHLTKELIEFLKRMELAGLEYQIEKSSFQSNKTELEADLKNLRTNQSKTYTLEQADSILEEAISKYESRNSG